MNQQELNNQVEANDYTDELTDEALDRVEVVAACNPGTCFSNGHCVALIQCHRPD